MDSAVSQPAVTTVMDDVEFVKFDRVCDTAPTGPATVTATFMWMADALGSLSTTAMDNFGKEHGLAAPQRALLWYGKPGASHGLHLQLGTFVWICGCGRGCAFI